MEMNYYNDDIFAKQVDIYNGDGETDMELRFQDGVLHDNNPNTITSPEWIWVTGNKSSISIPNIAGIKQTWELLKVDGPTAQDLNHLALEFGLTSGKFIISVASRNCCKVWEIVRNATILMELGTMSRTTRQIQKSRYIIYVFVDDYFDEDLFRVKNKLDYLGLKYSFKPDIYTECGIYSNNEWGIRPSLEFR